MILPFSAHFFAFHCIRSDSRLLLVIRAHLGAGTVLPFGQQVVLLPTEPSTLRQQGALISQVTFSTGAS